VNNVFIKGPSSSDRFVGEFAITDHIYQSGNIVDLNRNGKLDARPVTVADFAGCTLVPAPWAPPLAADSALTAFRRVLADAGSSRHRDATDARLIAQVASLGTRGEIVQAPPATTDGEQR
ncbi:MAG: hypothetical protein M3Y28_07270, partial [Armatimonadota bacterium]|nr:hypothetical protein [Armatimonadota bacterium]